MDEQREHNEEIWMKWDWNGDIEEMRIVLWDDLYMTGVYRWCAGDEEGQRHRIRMYYWYEEYYVE